MLKILRPQAQKHIRGALNQCCCNFADDAKPSGPQNSSEDQKPANTEKALQKSNEVTQKDLEWRTPWHKREIKYYDLLRSFYKEDNNTSFLKWIQQPLDLRPSTIKKWWLKKVEQEEISLQEYLPERHNLLGPELACAHFIVHRGGAVKFHKEDKWIKAVDGEYQLPDRYRKGMYLQAIDCTDIDLRYEGLSNLRDLRNVEWLSVNGCQHMDDFCMDTITNIFSHSLRYLDLRNCLAITERGLGAVYKMEGLKILYLDDMLKDTRYELTCLLLEELMHGLLIKSDVINFEIK